MANYKLRVDPSDVKQSFIKADIDVHCCRYWKLSKWEYNDLSFSFWRIYYNSVAGACVNFQGKTIELDASKIVLIPPFTAYSTALLKNAAEGLNGCRIETFSELNELPLRGMVDHFFIHFNLGIRLDYVKPNIYVFETDNILLQLIADLQKYTIEQLRIFDHLYTVKLYALIFNLLSKVDVDFWKQRTNDPRVLKIIDYIDRNYWKDLTNNSLGLMVNMATNSFLRLFKQSMGHTIQQYIQKVRINKAILQMHNASESIESIAEKCGFSDRHHFSKVFKKETGMPPAAYRQQKMYF
ncbi:MAG: helix-turn-helix transcriptional regulator [Prolixibacteraceae bacterium]|nr:helix-turn-helix transcriptional regulator [Prolixibacteraceae bacterium]